MVVGLVVLGEEALVGAAGDDGGLTDLDYSEVSVGVVRVLHGDRPV